MVAVVVAIICIIVRLIAVLLTPKDEKPRRAHPLLPETFHTERDMGEEDGEW